MLKESGIYKSWGNFKFVFIENHGKSLTVISNHLYQKELSCLILLVLWHPQVSQSTDGGTWWLSHPCSSIITQQKWKTQPTFWPNQLLPVTRTKKCSFAAFVSYVEERPVLGHKFWHTEDLVSFGRDCGTWNFLPKMHTVEKTGTHLGWQMDLQISSLQDKRRKCIMQSEEKINFCVLLGLKLPTLRGPLISFHHFVLSPCILSFQVPRLGIFASLLCLTFWGHWVTLLISHLLLLACGGGRCCWEFENSYRIIMDKEMETNMWETASYFSKEVQGWPGGWCLISNKLGTPSLLP